jgi:small subunit ribosomal protein S4
MGDPKKKHKLFTTPKRPYDSVRLESDLKIIGIYGLRNKRELWRQHAELSIIRRRSRDMLSLDVIERSNKEAILINKLYSLGLINDGATLEDILTLSVEDLLERRLQTFIFRQGMAKSLFQARQLIAHGHISIAGRKVKAPSYIVKREDENSIEYSMSSPMHTKEHPLRLELTIEEAKGGVRPE